MKYLNEKHVITELTYNDVFLVPQYSEVASRFQVDITPAGNFGAKLPILVANMNAVAGKRMAETTARRGALTMLPQDMDLAVVERIVSHVKSAHHVFDTPIFLSPDDSIQTALNLIGKRSHGAIVVVDENKKPVGIFSEKDAEWRDRFMLLKQVMNADIITVPNNLSAQEMYALLNSRHISFAPVVDENGVMLGAVTKKGAVRSTLYAPGLNKNNELIIGAAVGINKDVAGRVEQLKKIGVDCILLDTAHGHQAAMLKAVQIARAVLGPDYPLIAGTVVTAAGTQDLIKAGASIIKVGIGAGAMCTTRMMTGNGRPQFSAVVECAEVARAAGALVVADAGIRHPRDVVLALAAGAHYVMFGSWFAGTHESVGDLHYDEHGRPYKENFGMASRRAVVDRNNAAAIFEQARRAYFEEGISSSRLYLSKETPGAEDILDQITAGLRSACSYAGARNLEEFFERAVVGVQTASGYGEGKPVRESW